jgi:orotate phosphoribosyltransferase
LSEIPAGDSTSQQLISLLQIRHGHFQFESGHHGDIWLDLDGLFNRPDLLQPLANELAERLRSYDVNAVCGPMTGGALLAQMIAEQLKVEFYFAERISAGNDLKPEYRLPPSLCARSSGQRIAVVDDAINAGSAVSSTLTPLHDAEAKPVVVGALLILGDAFERSHAAQEMPVEYLARLPIQLWPPADCPICHTSIPLVTSQICG